MRFRPLGFVDDLLLQFSKKLAKVIAKQFNLKYKKISLFEWDDSIRLSARGACWSNKEICLDFRTKDLKGFAKIPTIISATVHELAHLVHLNHSPKFWRLNNKMLAWTMKNLVNPKE